MKPILEVKNISKKFILRHQAGYRTFRETLLDTMFGRNSADEQFWALRDVSFEVGRGESLGIIGRNGSGKSTLLKVLSSITPPTSGSVITRGRIASLLEVGTGFHPELTGRENVFFNGSLLGMNRKEIISKFDEIVAFSGTEKFLDTPLKHFSSGMQLRLAFSVAAFLEPEILIVDEVLAVGDAEFQRKCISKMEDVLHGGKTILFVSHNMAAVEQLCKRALLLNSGNVITQGESYDVIRQYIKRESDSVGAFVELHRVNKHVQINDLQVKLVSDESPFQHLSFAFTIRSGSFNPISGLALLLFNDVNDRVGILDLRNEMLYPASSEKNEISVEGTIRNIPLVEGLYFVGVNIVSNLYQGDTERLAKFELSPVKRETVAFDKQYRGYVEFDFVHQIR